MAGRPFRLVVTGGGTGGHTYPALTAVRTLREHMARNGRSLDVLWIGSADGLETRVAAAEGIPFESVVVGRIRRESNPVKMLSPANAKDMSNVPRGALQARRIIKSFAPDVALATGGYVAVPVGLGAHWCKKPLVVHEQTVRLGLANRVLASRASFVALSSESSVELLPESVRPRAVVTGNPVRPEMLAGQGNRAVRGLQFAGYNPQLPTVYVTGGAQGAQQINDLIVQVLPWLLERANVIHQCGPRNLGAMGERTRDIPPQLQARYHLTGYMGSELPDVMALADVVVSRSGAGTIAELTALGKASILIPYAAAAGNEQAHNANQLHQDGAALALPGEVTGNDMRQALHHLLGDSAARDSVSKQARAHGRPDAADRLVDLVLTAAAG